MADFYSPRRPGRHPNRPVIQSITNEDTGEVTEVNEPAPKLHGISLRLVCALLLVVSLTAGFFVSRPHHGLWVGDWLFYSLLFAIGIPLVVILSWEYLTAEELPTEEPKW